MLLALMLAVTLSVMGQPLWCQCGSLSPWSMQVQSSHNSQHLIDPYSLTHVLHGVLFWAGLRLLPPRASAEVRLALCAAVESVWEVFENTDTVIQRYREATISLDYFGDSVLNSLADVAACVVGYALASRVPGWVTVLAFVLTELVLVAWIRDSLLLNMIMLVHPIEAIKAWQGGA
jgi:hypothetical protein